MRNFIFFLFLLNSPFFTAQNSDTKELGIYSEVGLYTMDKALNIETLKKELQTVFPEATFITEAPKAIDKTMIYLSPVTDVPTVYPVFDMEYLNYFAEGFTLAQKENLKAAKNAMICVLFFTEKNRFSYNRKFNNWIYKNIKDTDFVAYDGETREYFLPETWKAKRVDAWENGVPNMNAHITGHSYRKNEFCRSITLGMQRFGLPDLIVENSPCSNIAEATQLITIIAQLMVEGESFEKENFTIDLEAIKNTKFKEMIADIIYENADQKATVQFKEGVHEDGDPYNLLLEVDFDDDTYPNPQTYQDEVYKKLFGSEDELTMVSHNKEIMAASERAKKRLPAMQKIFNDGLPIGTTLLLKAPFTTDDGGNEWMWIEVTKWNDENIEGILQNEPYYIKNLKSGTKVTVQQADVFDYILKKPDGTSEGNETGKLIIKYGN